MAKINASRGALRHASQSATQAAVGALTSAASVGVPTKTEFDKVVVDLATLRTAHNALVAALKTAGIVAT